jgi:hypothetical protein
LEFQFIIFHKRHNTLHGKYYTYTHFLYLHVATPTSHFFPLSVTATVRNWQRSVQRRGGLGTEDGRVQAMQRVGNEGVGGFLVCGGRQRHSGRPVKLGFRPRDGRVGQQCLGSGRTRGFRLLLSRPAVWFSAPLCSFQSPLVFSSFFLFLFFSRFFLCPCLYVV